MPVANEVTSPSRTRIPCFPSSITSARPPTRGTTEGFPSASASIKAIDRPSCSEVKREHVEDGRHPRRVLPETGEDHGVIQDHARSRARRSSPSSGP